MTVTRRVLASLSMGGRTAARSSRSVTPTVRTR